MQLNRDLNQLPVRFFGGELNKERIEQYRLRFGADDGAKEPEKAPDPKWADEASKAVAAMRLGGAAEVRTIKRSEVVW